MDAVLLAGGFGTRLRPLTYTRPKPLLPVAGRPMVEWVLDRLPEEVDRVVVAVNWQAETLERYFAQSPRDLEFTVVREDEPLGTAGAVKNCQDHLSGGPLFVLNADIVSSLDLGSLVTAIERHDARGAIALFEVPEEDVVHYGVVDAGDPEGPENAVRIRHFVEKPPTPAEAPSRLINAGAYLLREDVLDLIPAGRLVSMEKEIFPQLLDDGFYGVPSGGYWIDVGDPARLLQASRMLDPDTWCGPGVTVAPDATIERSVAGSRAHIGAGAQLKRCVLGDDVVVSDGVRLVDCVIGDGEHVRDDAEGQRIWTQAVPPGYPDKQVGNTLAR